MKTRWLRALLNLGQETIQEQNATMLHCSAKAMHADELLKTLEITNLKLFSHTMLSRA